MKGTTLTTLLTLIASGPHLHAQTPKEVRGAIDGGNAQYIAAFANADARALAGVYDRNGARLSPNGAVTRGQEAIAREVAAFLDRAGPVTVTIETVDLWVVDDVAYETGLWSYTFTPQGEEERTVGGRYVTIWKQQASGGWKILADMGVPGTSP